MKETKYYVNEAKRTVVCVISLDGEYEIENFIGKAKCSPEDSWDEEKGKEIARLRAMIKVKSWVRKNKLDTIERIDWRIDQLQKLRQKYLNGDTRNAHEIAHLFEALNEEMNK